MKIITAIGLLLVSVHLGHCFLIGAFNIKSFGDSKATNATLLNIITNVSNMQNYKILVHFHLVTVLCLLGSTSV